jgi:hypothetical protein
MRAGATASKAATRAAVLARGCARRRRCRVGRGIRARGVAIAVEEGPQLVAGRRRERSVGLKPLVRQRVVLLKLRHGLLVLVVGSDRVAKVVQLASGLASAE